MFHNFSKSNFPRPEYWDKFAKRQKNKSHIDTVLGKYKSEEFIRLVKKWSDNLEQKKVLKTDLREEAYGEDQVLFSLSDKNLRISAVDISEQTVREANMKRYIQGFLHNYITADVRNLPFKDDMFDLILSNSTLDHFTNQDDFKKSLLELKRVTNSKGLIIITLNNKHNVYFYLLLKVGRLFGFIPYPGTVNLEILREDLGKLMLIQNEEGIRLIPPDPQYCEGRTLKASIGSINGCLFIPPQEVNIHKPNIIEFMAPVMIKSNLGVEDGAILTITVEGG